MEQPTSAVGQQSARPTIVLPDDYQEFFTNSPELDRLGEMGEVRHYVRPSRDAEELLERLEEAEVLFCVRERTLLSAELLARLPELKLIALTGSACSHIDVEAATARGIPITTNPIMSVPAVAELAIGLMLAVLRRIPQRDRALRAGEWDQALGNELFGKTLGILGLGNIGRVVAHLGQAFGKRVLAWGPTLTSERAAEAGVRLVSMEELLRQADVVSLHLKVSPTTRGILGRQEIAWMKRSAILVNTARAELTDEQALAEALSAGHIAGAGLDVYLQEPLPATSPLLRLDNVVLSPHVGWITRETTHRFGEGTVQNIANWLRGAPTNVVNPAALRAR
ncbi:MAG: D-2-hydroxyacid dehydrogenase family protein [Chloroflexi bacterium]|nr:D-2-hydroxyacid dehydrogenase family protein [Chloroflexota bacterium]